jgi:glycosyltransferase involved in cell wall biosynthesis
VLSKKKTLGIAIFTPYFAPFWEYGGPVRSVEGLVKMLCEYSDSICVITTVFRDKINDAEQWHDLPTNCKIKYCRISSSRQSLLGKLFFSFGVMSAGVNAVRKASTVYVNGLWTWPSLIGVFLAILFRRRLIISPRGMLMPPAMAINGTMKRFLLVFYRLSMHYNRACVHWTTSTEKNVSMTMGSHKTQNEIIPNVVYNEAFWERVVSSPVSERLSVLYLGRIHPIKNLNILLEAVAKIVSRGYDIEVKLLGDGCSAYIKQLKQQVMELDISDKIHFLGPNNSDDRIREIDSCHIGILVSQSENFGMAAAEFLARGRPVILSRGVALSDFFRDSDAVWVVNSDVQSVEIALIEAANKIKTRKVFDKMTIDARLVAEQYFAPESQIAPFLDLFKFKVN